MLVTGHIGYGGEGALYVRVRRARTRQGVIVREGGRSSIWMPCVLGARLRGHDSADHQINRLRSVFFARSPTCFCT